MLEGIGKERLEALIAASELKEFEKNILVELLHIDPVILKRTAAYSLGEGLEKHGPGYLLSEEGSLKDPHSLGMTPQSYEQIFRAAARRKLASALTTGSDLFAQLRENPKSIPSLRDLFEAAPDEIRMQYIRTVYNVFAENEKTARRILQEIVDIATGFEKSRGDTEDSSGFFFGRMEKDAIARGISYIAKALDLGPLNLETKFLPHPAMDVLEEFIRSLPKGEKFKLEPLPLRPGQQKSLEEQLAKNLTPKQQETSNAIYAWLNRNKDPK